MDKTMLKQWTDAEIEAFANNAPSAWEARRLYDGMRKVRDDLQERITELEAKLLAVSRELVSADNAERYYRGFNHGYDHAETVAAQRIAELEEQAPQPPPTGAVGNVASMRNAIIIAHSMATQHHIQSDEVMRQRIGEVLWKVIEADDVMRGVLGYGGPEAHRDILGGTGSLEDSDRPTATGTGEAQSGD